MAEKDDRRTPRREDEKAEGESQESRAGAEAFAAAVTAIASRQDPQVARDTSTFLNKQARLLDIQAKHLEEGHAMGGCPEAVLGGRGVGAGFVFTRPLVKRLVAGSDRDSYETNIDMGIAGSPRCDGGLR